MRSKRQQKGKLGHVPISDEITYMSIEEVFRSPKNDQVYKPVDMSELANQELADSVARLGVKEPLLVSEDCYIISGHRRYAAAKHAGLKRVPCRIADITYDDPRFLPLLREMNRQRVKTLDEILREEVISSASPEESYTALLDERKKRSEIEVDTIALGSPKKRARISDAKRPLLEEILKVVRDNKKIGKLSVRQIFYLLLNVNPPPLVHASKPQSGYHNSPNCYKAVDDLCVRARLTGQIPFDAIHDPTRPVVCWKTHVQTAPFIHEQLDGFLKNYWRDLMQSQQFPV